MNVYFLNPLKWFGFQLEIESLVGLSTNIGIRLLTSIKWSIIVFCFQFSMPWSKFFLFFFFGKSDLSSFQAHLLSLAKFMNVIETHYGITYAWFDCLGNKLQRENLEKFWLDYRKVFVFMEKKIWKRDYPGCWRGCIMLGV